MSRLRRALDHPRFVAIALTLGVVLCLPALRVGRLLDDLLQQAMLQGTMPTYDDDPWSLYAFFGNQRGDAKALIHQGVVPWWTSPDIAFTFFRPLSSGLLALDGKLFGGGSLLPHLHSVLWFVLLCGAAFAVLREVLPGPASRLALLIYTVSGSHSTPTAWLAARHTIVAGTLGMAAIALHLRARRLEHPALRAASALCLIGALLASEVGLGAVAMIAAFEAWGATGTWRSRVVAALPALAFGVGYLVTYQRLGYGVHGSGSYISPFGDPLAFAFAALPRIGALLSELFAAVPSMGFSSFRSLQPVFWSIGLVMTLVVGGWLRGGWGRLDDPTRRTFRWLLPGCFATLVPMVGGVIDGRMLVFALIGGSAIIASCLLDFLGTERGWRTPLGALAGFLLFAHFVVSPMVRAIIPSILARGSSASDELLARADLRCDRGARAIVLVGADPTISMYGGPAIAVKDRQRLSSFQVLSMAPQDHEVEPTGPTSLLLRTRGARLHNEFEHVFRSLDEPIRVGDEVQTELLHIEVTRVDGDVPTELRVESNRRFDDPSMCVLVWKDGILQSLALPERGVIPILHEPGPLGM